MILLKWASVIGLVFDAAGAFSLAYGLMISKDDAIELAIAYSVQTTKEKNLQLPPVKDRLIQSRNAKIGLALLIIGFALQLVGAWPSSSS